MAYFPNGTSRMNFEEHFCFRCVHRPVHDVNPPKDCAVLTLHWMWNYDQLDKSEVGVVKQIALYGLIPEIEINGVRFPGRCRMFFEAQQEDPSTQLNMFGE